MISNKSAIFSLCIAIISLSIFNVQVYAGKFDYIDNYLKSINYSEAENNLNSVNVDSLSNTEKAEYYLKYTRLNMERSDSAGMKTYLDKAEAQLKSLNNPAMLADFNILKSAYYYITENPTRAEYFLQQAESISENNLIKFTQGEVHELKGIIAAKNADYATSMLEYEQAINYFEQINNSRKLVETTNYFAESMYLMGNYYEALSLFAETLERSKSFGFAGEELRSLISLATIYYTLGDATTALDYNLKAVELGEKKESKEKLLQAYTLLSAYYNYTGQDEKALEILSKAMNVSKKPLANSNTSGVETSVSINPKNNVSAPDNISSQQGNMSKNNTASSLSEKADAEASKGNDKEALALYQQYLSDLEKNQPQNYDEIASTYSKMADIYKLQNDYDKAISLSHKAIDVINNAYGPDSMKVISYYLNIASIYFLQGNYQVAIDWYNKFFTIYDKLVPTDDPIKASYYTFVGLAEVKQGHYENAKENLFRALKIYEFQTPKDYKYISDVYRKIGYVYVELADYDTALEWYNKALSIDNTHMGPNHESTASSYSELGDLYNKRGKYDEAIKYYEKALTIREQLHEKGDPTIIVTLNNLATAYKEKGNFEKALELYDRSRQISEDTYGINNALTSVAYNNIAEAYTSSGDYNKALEWHFKTLDIIKNTVGEDHSEAMLTYSNIAAVYDYLGDYNKALEWYLKAAKVGKNDPAVGRVYSDIAEVYANQAKYDEALKYCQKSLAEIERIAGINHPDSANTYNVLANIYIKQGKYDQAYESLNNALYINEKVYGKDHPKNTVLYSNIALVLDSQGKKDEALDWNFKSLALNEKVYGADHISNAISYNNIAAIYTDKKDYRKALEYLMKSYNLYNNKFGKEHPQTASIENNIGAVYKKTGNYSEAIKWLTDSLNTRINLLGPEHPDTAFTYNNLGRVYEASGDSYNAEKNYLKAVEIADSINHDYYKAEFSYDLAKLFEKNNNFSKALHYYEKGISAYEALRNYAPSEEDRFRISTNLLQMFEGAINCAFKTGDLKKAFNLSEQSKARNLIQSIASQEAKYNAGIDKNDLDKLNNLEEALQESQEQCYGVEAEKQLSEISGKKVDNPEKTKQQFCQQYRSVRDELVQFKNNLDIKYPKYSEMRFPAAVSDTDLLTLLNKPEYSNTVLVEYFLGKDNLYIWTISSNGINGYSKPVSKDELEDNIDSFIGSLRAASYAGNYDAQINILNRFNEDAAYKLYEALIEPIENSLHAENVIIIPHGILYYLPFDALVTAVDSQDSLQSEDIALSQFKNTAFLGKKYNISYLPSASILIFKDRHKKPNYNDRLFIVANPKIDYLQNEIEKLLDKPAGYSGAETRIENSITSRAVDNRSSLLLSLPYSEVEGKFIKDLYQGKADLLVGSQATEKAVKDKLGMYKDYHISSHGIMDDETPYMSGIVLSKGDDYGHRVPGMDGILYAYELAGTDLNADTVVLSACDTGLGKMIAGEGMVGLSRSFLVSGADTLVISLWQVNDASTSELMKDFYLNKEQSGNKNKSAALKNAKLKMLDSVNTNIDLTGYKGISYAHPYFWAPFILSGNWR